MENSELTDLLGAVDVRQLGKLTNDKEEILFLIRSISAARYADEAYLASVAYSLLLLAKWNGMHYLSFETRKDKHANYTDLAYSMVKICLTNYSIQKKIVVLLGMIWDKSQTERIDICAIIRKIYNVKK
jgi:hypothetical protein